MFKRKVFTELIQYLDSDEFFLLHGSRQVGKTTLLRMLEEHLREKGEKTYFFDMEDLDYLAEFNTNPKNLFSHIELSEGKKVFVFIDEIQYLENPSNFIKYLFDHHKDQIKLICTGSASLEIKSKIQDSLVGRHYAFRIQPLTFFEFLNFKKIKISGWDLETLTDLQKKQLNEFLEEFLLFGGMPAVVLKESVEEKKKLLKSYVETYVQKDIRAITVIKDLVKYNFLMKMLAGQAGNLLNINNLAENLSISFPTAKRYVEILEHTHIISLIPPYLQSVHKQIRKMHKLYFYDTGIRNALLNNFEILPVRNDQGALFENMVANELFAFSSNLFFYRTKNDAEIDFILDEEKLHLIEVKYKDLAKVISPKAFSTFGKSEKKQKKYVINKSFFFEDKAKDVSALPFYLLGKIR